MNARNLLYIKPFNPKKAVALADSKLKTKAFLSARGIPVARLHAKIGDRSQLRSFDFSTLPDRCVLKPNEGFGGEGIVVFDGRNDNGDLLKNGKEPWTADDLVEHIEDILDGKFSLGGRPDMAFFEQILRPHDCFARFRPMGLPDLRVIVFNLVPVMAMLRVPTAASDGKANIHLGGIGIGMDIAKGVTTHAVQYSRLISALPHGGSPAGIPVPFWDEILLICSRIQYVTNIGYLAADITIDQDGGPMVLEVNARAGLTVQVANLAPLRARLERVAGLKVSSPEKGVRLGQDLFGEKVTAPLQRKDMSEQPVLGLMETLTVHGKGEAVEIPCRITPGHEESVMDGFLLQELAALGAAEPLEGSPGYRIKCTLGGRKIQTVVLPGPVESPAQAAIGQRDLTGFLIDPSKKPATTPRLPSAKVSLPAMDQLLSELDAQLLPIKYLKPLNLQEERAALADDPAYNPVFLYPLVPVNLPEAEERLSVPVGDESPLGLLLESKRVELLRRIELLRARGHADRFTAASKALFDAPSPELLATALAQHRGWHPSRQDRKKDLTSAQAAAYFTEVLHRYSLHNWSVVVRPRLVATVTVGGRKIFIREDARFSKDDLQGLTAHEIETHVLTAENGDHQPVALLRRGTAGYLETQEGLALWNQNRVIDADDSRRVQPARNVLALAHALEHPFAETRRYLEEDLGCTPEKAVIQSITLKRGLSDTSEPGAFTKSAVYLRGLLGIESFLAGGGDLRRLYVGKIALDELALVEGIRDLQPPLLLPDFLRVKT